MDDTPGGRFQGPRQSRRTVALTVLGKLHEQRASSWKRYGRELNKASGPMRASYAPLRSACNKMLAGSNGYEATMEYSMEKFKPTPQAISIIDNSRQGLDFLRSELMPKVLEIKDDFVNESEHFQPVPFGPVLLTGGFHCKVILADGDPAIVYIHPSSWTNKETKANFELLGFVALHRHELPVERTLFVDIPNRRIKSLPPSNPNLLHALEETADLYATLFFS